MIVAWYMTLWASKARRILKGIPPYGPQTDAHRCHTQALALRHHRSAASYGLRRHRLHRRYLQRSRKLHYHAWIGERWRLDRLGAVSHLWTHERPGLADHGHLPERTAAPRSLY